MSRKNRKKRVHGFVLPAPFAGVVVLGSLLALLYVWLGSRCDSLGRDIKALEAEKTDLKKELLNEESRWTQMKSPVSMEAALAKHHLVMTWPRRDQIVHLSASGQERDYLPTRTQSSLTYMRREKAVIHD